MRRDLRPFVPVHEGAARVAAGCMTGTSIDALDVVWIEATGFGLELRAIQDFRNYKVSCDKARTSLGFMPKYSIQDTVRDVHEHRGAYGDYEKDEFYNIRVFEGLEPSPRR